MDENKLKKQLFRVTSIVIISSLVVCLLFFCAMVYLSKELQEAEYIQMQKEVKEYKNRITKQIDKNFEILTTLSEVYKACIKENAVEILKNSSDAINNANSFMALFFFSEDGEGFLSTKGQETIDCTIDICSNDVREVIERSLQGEIVVSKIYDSKIFDERLCIYSVPVYEDGEIIGAIAASATLDFFEGIVNEETVMDGKGYIHLLLPNGDFLIRSKNTLIKEDVESIFDGPYLTEEEKAAAQQALDNQESFYGEFRYNDQECHFYMEPLELNGWYIFCANHLWEYVLYYRRIFLIIIGTFCLILAILLFLIYFGYLKFRRNSASLLRLVSQDPVTNAKNTYKFDEEFQEYRKKSNQYSIVALNVHNFKGINDLFGKANGNKVLCYIKDTIEYNLREGEFFCRDAADLFYILMHDIDHQAVSERISQIIYHINKASASYGEYSYELLLYAGVAIQGDREKALVAMQSIQHIHSKSIAFYNQSLHEEVRKKNSIESCMHQALQNKEFKLFLQPKFDLKTNQIIGAEALVRWQKTNGSYRYPNEFIPLFEENGFCVNLDLYMVERVCEQLRTWMDAGMKPIPISINQSKLLFLDRNYPKNLKNILDHYQIPSNLITLEILEGIASDNISFLNQQIEILQENGFRVSMDDFGSGYSTLNMLYQLRIDELKLDRGFLKKASVDDEKRRNIILEEVICLAKKLGMVVVAEGIETQQDREKMLNLSCNYGQGYFFEKPMAATDFSKKYVHG